MNIIYCLVVLYFTVTSNLCVCEFIGETNLTYNTNYFIKLSSNNDYLRWDGNTNEDVSGLAYVTQTNLINSTDETLIQSYIFVIERDMNSMIKIKNVRTNRYISYYESIGFILANSTAFNNSLKLLHFGNSLSIVSPNTTSITFLYSSFGLNGNILVYYVSKSAEISTIQFIAAPNITQTASPFIGDTNLMYDTNYFIKLESNHYLRWDGNNNGDVSGLTYVSKNNLTNSTDESLIRPYIFVIERDLNSLIKVRNVFTNRYISYYLSSDGFVLTDSSAYNNSLRRIVAANDNSMYFLSPNTSAIRFFNSVSDFRIRLWINSISSTSTTSWKYYFITAPNITQSLPPVIGDTDLKFDTNYFIKLSSKEDFLHWDGNNDGDISGLTYFSQTNLINSTDESFYKSFIFVIERDVNSKIKIKNVITDRYISYYNSSYGFVLADSNAYNNSLRIVINSTNNSLAIVSANASSNAYLYSSYKFTVNLQINTVSSSSSSRIALQFIAAPNITHMLSPVIGDTYLIYDTNYFIKQSTNNIYLRCDGNNNGDISGLAYVTPTDLTNSADESLIRQYIFVIERDVNYMIKIKNVITNRYISYYESHGFVLSNSSAYNNSLRLVNPDSSKSYSLAILSPNATSTSYIDSFFSFKPDLWINSLTVSSSATMFYFLVAPNITQNTQRSIGDTDLTYGNNYFIKSSANNDYLRWDGNSNGEFSGLIFDRQINITSITDESERDAYQFVIEPDVNNTIKLRNIRTNRYLSYYNSSFDGFVLSNNSTYKNSFRLLLNPETNSIYLAESTTTSTSAHYFSNQHLISSSLFLYYIQGTWSIYYFQFIIGS